VLAVSASRPFRPPGDLVQGEHAIGELLGGGCGRGADARRHRSGHRRRFRRQTENLASAVEVGAHEVGTHDPPPWWHSGLSGNHPADRLESRRAVIHFSRWGRIPSPVKIHGERGTVPHVQPVRLDDRHQGRLRRGAGQRGLVDVRQREGRAPPAERTRDAQADAVHTSGDEGGRTRPLIFAARHVRTDIARAGELR
jgi:hypothetical protein